MNFFQYNQKLLKQAEKNKLSTQRLSNDAVVVRGGKGVRVVIVSGLHGDEKSGPLGILDWLSKSGFRAKVSFLIIPLINNEGWNKSERLWRGKDLNRAFGQKRVDFIDELGKILTDFRPELFLDFHEDEKEDSYFYRLAKKEYPLYYFLKRSLALSERSWGSFEKWKGSSEVFVRRLGCKKAVTIELAKKNEKERNNQLIKNILREVFEKNKKIF